MNNISFNRKKRVNEMKNLNSIYERLLKSATVAIAVIAFFCLTLTEADSQVIKHPVGDDYSSAVFFTHRMNFNDQWMKELRYFIVQGTDKIMVSLDACDFCYVANKGYSQSDSAMRCNSCGNGYLIDSLGTQIGDACAPVKLIYTIDENFIYLDVAELESKEKYFPTIFVSVNDNLNAKPDVQILNNSNEIAIGWVDSAMRDVQLLSIDGKLLISQTIENDYALMDISEINSGVYFLMFTESGNSYSQKISITK